MKTFNYLGMCVYVCAYLSGQVCFYHCIHEENIVGIWQRYRSHSYTKTKWFSSWQFTPVCSGNSLCKKLFSANLDIRCIQNHINSTHFSHPLRIMKALGKHPLNHSFSIICCLRFHHSSSHHLCLTQQVQGFISVLCIYHSLWPFFQQPGSSCSGAKTDERQKHVAFTKSVHLGGCKMIPNPVNSSKESIGTENICYFSHLHPSVRADSWLWQYVPFQVYFRHTIS